MTGSLPNVGRPKGSAWRNLQDEDIVWEGQVLITGDDTDLAALLLVTNHRLAFVRGGAIALDIEREWLDPAPVLRRTGTVQLWVSPPGDPISESITFIARDGRDEAAVLLSLIGDHGSYGAAYRMPTYVSEEPPAQPGYPLARSRKRRAASDTYNLDAPPALPVFSILDDDDFPPVVANSDVMPGWEEAIAEALESGAPLPIAGSIRNPNDPLKPIQGFDSKLDRDRRSWVVRLVGLFLVIGLGSVIASGILPGLSDVQNLFDDDKTPTAVSVAEIDSPREAPEVNPTPTTTPEPTITVSGPSSSDPKDPTVVPIETAVALGVGSDEPSETPFPTTEPTATNSPEENSGEVVQAAQATEESTETEDDTSQQTAVNPPPDLEPTATTEPTPTATEAEVAPTGTREESSESGLTEEPETVSDASLRNQAASLESSDVPAQTFVMDGLRLQISSAYRADTLPDLTLGRNSAGEWVVLILEGTNWSSEPANLDMTGFRLAPTSDLAAEIALDASSGAVASYLGLTPTIRPTESTVVPAGGYQPVALVFSVAPGLGNLTLLAGNEVIALDLAFDNQSEKSLAGSALAPELVQGTVVEVVDGQSIAVDVAGEISTVFYYGLRLLEADSCYAGESTEANALLTEGQTVFVERERRNRSESTTYLRDVWVKGESGELKLVAAALVADGAAVPDPSEPDIRFAGWLAGEALVAETSGAGLWSACADQS